MAEIRYTLSGNYNAADSYLAERSNGPFDFTDSDIQDVSILSDRFYVGTSQSSSALFTNSLVHGTVFVNSLLDGVSIDFSDRTTTLLITGGGQGDVIRSGSGNDFLDGGAGNDVIEAGRGHNNIAGGDGSDTISYEHFDAPSETSPGVFVGMSVNLQDGTGYDNAVGIYEDSFSGIENIRGSAFTDLLEGDANNNVIEGGGGADTLVGSQGIDTVSYAHSAEGVTVTINSNSNTGGDAQGDTLMGFENILGSAHADFLQGNLANNTLNGNGGADTLFGLNGDDRLVIAATPSVVDGGDGLDLLFISAGSDVTLTSATITDIEQIYVRNDARLDMSGVTIGTVVSSQSQSGHGSTIIGTSGDDRIKAGKGGDDLSGGTGNDTLTGGTGADTFHFAADGGRDVIRKFDLLSDTLNLSGIAESFEDLVITAVHGGGNTLITVAGDPDPSNKIILVDVLASAVTADQFGFVV